MNIFGESFLYSLGLFLDVNVQNWKMFLWLLNFNNIFWVCQVFLIFLVVSSRCWVEANVFRKYDSIPNGVRHS